MISNRPSSLLFAGAIGLVIAAFFVARWSRKDDMASSAEPKAQAAWNRIESLGGHGVWEGSWESDMVVVSLADTGVTDDDLRLFDDFPWVQILDLSGTSIGDVGLSHVAKIPRLEDLIICDTRISEGAIERLRASRPGIKVKTQRPPKDAINPFTGKPFDTPNDS